jgi:ABC-2 type transport system ATP-binding protein
MLLGLTRPDSGSVRLFGQLLPTALPSVMPRIGAVVESPAFFPTFTGRRNLSLLGRVAGVPAVRIDEVLEIVGLSDRADDRYASYSMGMRQRLAIAATLLKSPGLIILDEPTNGLDPAGIHDVRAMMRTMAASGTTVLLSSHLLAEVQQVCDSVTIINRGQHVVSGRVAEVLAARSPARYQVRLADPDGGADVARAAGYQVTTSSDGALLVEPVRDAAALTRTLAEAGHYVSELTPRTVDLEQVFLELTGGPVTPDEETS